MLGNTNANDIILPNLTNPATAAEILTGYQAIDEEGNMLTGTAQSGGNYEVTIVAGSGTSQDVQLNGKPLMALFYEKASRSSVAYCERVSGSSGGACGNDASASLSCSYNEETKVATINYHPLYTSYTMNGGTVVILSEVN